MVDTGPESEVVVGVDGSEESRRAVLWAAAEARRRQRPLRIVHAWLWPSYHVPLGPPPGGPPGSGLRAQAERLLDEARAVATQNASGLAVSTSLVHGAADEVLTGLSSEAELIVVGNRGLGGFGGLLLGSTGLHLAAHSACPVVVVRGDVNHAGPVLVGVEASEGAGPVVGQAVEFAALHGLQVVALTVWEFPVTLGPDLPGERYYQERHDQAETSLEEAVLPWRDKHPGVTIDQRVVQSSPAGALIDESRRAALVVVGTHRLGSFRGLVLGSVCHAVLHHAHCPVMVVPPDRPPR